MNEKLFEILNEDELKRLKQIGLTRNVRIKDLTLSELEELKKVLFPTEQKTDIIDVLKTFKSRRVI